MIGRRQAVGQAAKGLIAAVALALVGAAGCTPTVKIEAPEEPIVINLNVKIEQEVRVKIERELEQAFEQNPELFE